MTQQHAIVFVCTCLVVLLMQQATLAQDDDDEIQYDESAPSFEDTDTEGEEYEEHYGDETHGDDSSADSYFRHCSESAWHRGMVCPNVLWRWSQLSVVLLTLILGLFSSAVILLFITVWLSQHCMNTLDVQVCSPDSLSVTDLALLNRAPNPKFVSRVKPVTELISCSPITNWLTEGWSRPIGPDSSGLITRQSEAVAFFRTKLEHAGKTAQRPNLPKTEYVKNPDQYFKLVFDDAKTAKTVAFHGLNTQAVSVTYEDKDAFVVENPTTNPVFAAFVTAHARLHLLRSLEALGADRVLYYDTDSIVYVTRPGQQDLPTGDYLGDLTDELEGGRITEFYSAGPKQYAYRWVDANGREQTPVVKVRGITLNYVNGQKLRYKSFKDMVETYLVDVHLAQALQIPDAAAVARSTGPKLQLVYDQIRRHADRTITTTTASKTVRVVYDKCVVDGATGRTWPFGYRRQPI